MPKKLHLNEPPSNPCIITEMYNNASKSHHVKETEETNKGRNITTVVKVNKAFFSLGPFSLGAITLAM